MIKIIIIFFLLINLTPSLTLNVNERGIVGDIKDYVKDRINEVKSSLDGVKNNVVNSVNNKIQEFQNGFNGFKDQVNSKIEKLGSVINTLKELYNNVKEIILNIIKIYEKDLTTTLKDCKSRLKKRNMNDFFSEFSCRTKEVFEYISNLKWDSKTNKISFFELYSQIDFFSFLDLSEIQTSKSVDSMRINETIDGVLFDKVIPFWRISSDCRFFIGFSQGLTCINSVLGDLLSVIDSSEPTAVIAQLKMFKIKLLLNPIIAWLNNEINVNCMVYG